MIYLIPIYLALICICMRDPNKPANGYSEPILLNLCLNKLLLHILHLHPSATILCQSFTHTQAIIPLYPQPSLPSLVLTSLPSLALTSIPT